LGGAGGGGREKGKRPYDLKSVCTRELKRGGLPFSKRGCVGTGEKDYRSLGQTRRNLTPCFHTGCVHKGKGNMGIMPCLIKKG